MLLVILILFSMLPLITSQDAPSTNNSSNGSKITITEIKEGFRNATATNKWNETVILSPTWQKVLSSLFGLNLKKGTFELSVREAIVLFMILIMFAVVIFDIVKMIPFFNKPIFGFVKTEWVASVVITLLVSISGSFVSIKNIFLDSISYIANSLHWNWMNTALTNWWGGVAIGLACWAVIFFLHEFFDWFSPFIKRYSELSRAKAKGRALNVPIQQNAPEEVTK